MQYRKDGSEIAAELRNRICMMQSVADTITLHEGALATEFGVSRTPIRQVLQKLAYERLVETRSGVGTIVAPLTPAQRNQDVQVLKAMFIAAASCCAALDVSSKLRDRLAVLYTMAKAAEPSKETYLELRALLLDYTANAAPDAILADALRAAHWRHIRWRMAENAYDDPDAHVRLCATLEVCAQAAQENKMGAIYTELADRLI